MKTIIYYHPIKKKWQNWKDAYGIVLKFHTADEALHAFLRTGSVRNKIITKFKVINI